MFCYYLYHSLIHGLPKPVCAQLHKISRSTYVILRFLSSTKLKLSSKNFFWYGRHGRVSNEAKNTLQYRCFEQPTRLGRYGIVILISQLDTVFLFHQVYELTFEINGRKSLHPPRISERNAHAQMWPTGFYGEPRDRFRPE